MYERVLSVNGAIDSIQEPRLVTAFRKGEQVCVDLGDTHDFQNETLKKWRATVAKEFDSGPVSFQTGAVRMVHDRGMEGPASELTPVNEVSWSRVDEVYTPTGLRELIERENENARELLVAQLRSPMGVVPFVGAGLSMDFGFPGWPKFLTDVAEFHSRPEEVLSLIRANELIKAATLLAESADRFQLMVEKSFGRPVSEEQARTGAVSFLPMLASGPVITTNFDRVLEAAFLAAGVPFSDFITGVEPDNVIRAMHRNKQVLIKLHGDALDRSARVFTGLEYDDKYETISKLARIMFTNRPLLFLGCSLDKDRTLEVLEKIHEELPGLTHYAVLAGSYRLANMRKRRSELDSVGISPLWYIPGDYKRIEGILGELIQEASTRLIWKPKEANGEPAFQTESLPATEPSPVPDWHLGVGAFAIDPKIALMVRRLARRMVNGRLMFFLGAGAHLNPKLSARAFYRSIAEEHAIEERELQRAEAAQFIVDCEGRADAWITAKERLRTEDVRPSVVYEFLAELPSILRRSGKQEASAQWILTTNYDTMLERVFAGRQERFHLLYYQVDGKDAGRFLHRAPDASIRAIERPQNIRTLHDPAHVLVKLDGGIPWDEHFNETVAIAPIDFSISAGRLLTALPEAVRGALHDRSLLILGSSLQEAHVQNLIRWAAGTTRVTKTWAVQLDVSATAMRFWSAAGVELVACDLANFIGALKAQLLGFLNPAPDAQSTT